MPPTCQTNLHYLQTSRVPRNFAGSSELLLSTAPPTGLDDLTALGQPLVIDKKLPHYASQIDDLTYSVTHKLIMCQLMIFTGRIPSA